MEIRITLQSNHKTTLYSALTHLLSLLHRPNVTFNISTVETRPRPSVVIDFSGVYTDKAVLLLIKELTRLSGNENFTVKKVETFFPEHGGLVSLATIKALRNLQTRKAFVL